MQKIKRNQITSINRRKVFAKAAVLVSALATYGCGSGMVSQVKSKAKPSLARQIFSGFTEEQQWVTNSMNMGRFRHGREDLLGAKGLKLLIKIQENIPRSKKIVSELGIESVEATMNFAYAISVIGEEKALALNRELGIEYFMRYGPKTLKQVFENYIGQKQDKPVFLVVMSKKDWNGELYGAGIDLEQLLPDYQMIIAETETKEEFFSFIRKVSGKMGKIHGLGIGGHGSPESVILGEMYEKGMITLKDEGKLRRLRKMFVESPTAVLISCSTGKYADYTIGAMVSRALDATVYAPKTKASTKKYVLNSEGMLSNMIYNMGQTRKYSSRTLLKKEERGVLSETTLPRGHCIYSKDYVDAKESVRKKCKGDVSCITREFRSGYDDESSPFYKESFSAFGRAGDIMVRFPNEWLKETEMRIESIDEDGVVFMASGQALKYEILPSGENAVGFRHQVDRFRVDYGEKPVQLNYGNMDDFSHVGSGDLDVWFTVRNHLHLKSFSVEKTSQEGVVWISVHRQRFCDVKYDENY